MRTIVSPYHLTTREPPAMAALLLADEVVTLIPAPLGEFGHRELHAAVQRSPKYRRFIESWAWSHPLWRAGVIRSALDGLDATADVREACALIDRDPDLSPIRGLMRPELFESEEEYLAAVASDVLKGGPDPAISVPVAAGLDRFAARVGLIVMRSEPVSVAQRAEHQLSQRRASLVARVLLEANAEQILRARALLVESLDRLRAAIDFAGTLALEQDPAPPRRDPALEMASAEYDTAFARHLGEIRRCDPSDDRVVDGYISLSLCTLPADAVLRSSVAAARTLGRIHDPRAAATTTTLPVLRDPLKGERLVSLVVKSLGATREPAPRRSLR